MIRGLCPILALISLSCGGSSGAPRVSLPEVPPPETSATLVGPRCQGSNHCQCRDLTTPEAEEAPPAGSKRFELRVGPTQHELWVRVDDMVLFKSKQRATECFYLDLIPGEHAVQVHGKRDTGVGIGIQIYELNPAGPWWYPSFEFDCSSGGICDLDSLRREQTRIQGVPRGIHAECGSVRVQGLEWRTGTMPDALHPGEIVVDFVLNVYKFTPDKKPGTCE